MLRVSFSALQTGAAQTTAHIRPGDALFAGLDVALEGPLAVTGRLSESGPGQWYWHGRLEARLVASCRRCLAPVPLLVDTEVRAVFSSDRWTADPSVYLVESGATYVDLGGVVREELLMAVPEYVLCREECRGLCAQCGKDLNLGPCGCRPEPDPRWAALDGLRRGEPEDER